jgi:hypothetical protein
MEIALDKCYVTHAQTEMLDSTLSVTVYLHEGSGFDALLKHRFFDKNMV